MSGGVFCSTGNGILAIQHRWQGSAKEKFISRGFGRGGWQEAQCLTLFIMYATVRNLNDPDFLELILLLYQLFSKSVRVASRRYDDMCSWKWSSDGNDSVKGFEDTKGSRTMCITWSNGTFASNILLDARWHPMRWSHGARGMDVSKENNKLYIEATCLTLGELHRARIIKHYSEYLCFRYSNPERYCALSWTFQAWRGL